MNIEERVAALEGKVAVLETLQPAAASDAPAAPAASTGGSVPWNEQAGEGVPWVGQTGLNPAPGGRPYAEATLEVPAGFTGTREISISRAAVAPGFSNYTTIGAKFDGVESVEQQADTASGRTPELTGPATVTVRVETDRPGAFKLNVIGPAKR